MKIPAATCSAILASLSISACGGGDGGTAPPAGGPSYETLTSTAPLTSRLGGAALRWNMTTGVREIVTTLGTVFHETGRTFSTDATYFFTDPDGFDASGTLEDGNGSVASTDALTGGRDYAASYTHTFTHQGEGYMSVGVSGIITESEDVPMTGRAIYRGEAIGGFGDAGGVNSFNRGTSEVTADFAAGTVDVTMTGFRTESGASNRASRIDTIQVTGMTIQENRFSGGDLRLTLNGASVDPVPNPRPHQAQGVFYGHDGTAPDEVGGAVLLRGDGSFLAGGFIAD